MANNTILLIDYEPRSIERTKGPLTALGYRVAVATDGLAGLEAFERLHPDLVLIEAMIPKKHGFEVCQDLKKTPAGKRTPIIITTSVYKGRKYRTQALHMYGCDEYIEKPIPEDQFIEIIRRFLPVAVTSGVEADESGAMEEARFVEEPESSEDVIDLGSFDGESDAQEIEPPPRPPSRRAVEAPAARSRPQERSSSGSSPLADIVEDEIMARLDAIMPGASGSASSAAMALDPDPWMQQAAPAKPVMETTLADPGPDGIEIIEPEPVAEPAEQPTAQVVSFDAKRGKKNRKRGASGKSTSAPPEAKKEAKTHEPAATPAAPPPAPVSESERPARPSAQARPPVVMQAAAPETGMPGWVWLLVIAGLALAAFALFR